MPDGLIERAVQVVERRHQDQQVATGCQQIEGTAQFALAVLDVLDHVEIEDGVEALVRRERGGGSVDPACLAQLWMPHALRHLAQKACIGLKERPFVHTFVPQVGRVHAHARAGLQHAAVHVRGELACEIALPIGRMAEQVEFLADVIDLLSGHARWSGTGVCLRVRAGARCSPAAARWRRSPGTAGWNSGAKR